MLETALLEGSGDLAVRSFATCLAAVLEIPREQVRVPSGKSPEPAAEFTGAVALWRSWLSARGFGLAALLNPATFTWPGFWIAVVRSTAAADPEARVAVLIFGTPAGVVLSPAAPQLVGAAVLDLDVVAGFVVAGLDPAVPTPRPVQNSGGASGATREPGGAGSGVVEAVAIAGTATGPMEVVATAQAVAGRGLDGDRYAAKAGTFNVRNPTASGYDLTLIEAEVLEDLVLPDGTSLAFTEVRRNIATRGVDVDALVGRRFRIGDVTCIGRRRCEPCAHLERLTRPGTLRGLIHRGGLRADILTGGTITARMDIRVDRG